MRMSSDSDRQTTDLQRDALLAAGVDERHLFEDHASGAQDDRPGLISALAFVRPGDVLVVWKLDRLGRSLSHLLTIVNSLRERNVAFRSLTEGMDTTTASGELLFDEKTQITVLSDGDAGLGTVQREVAPGSEHILDWFHIGMRLEHLLYASRAMQMVAPAAHGSESANNLATRAKWALWNGQADKTFARLEELRRWTLAERGPTPEVRNLHRHATDLRKYLRANQDSLPDYGERQREGEPFSTGWVESAINEIIAKRMAKSQQMRWNRWTVQPFLAVRVAVLNDILADSFRGWLRGFRPVDPNVPELRAA
jgi:hypothetical protein